MQDTAAESTQSKCDLEGHIGKISETEYRLEDGNVNEYTTLYGCTRCDATSPEPWSDWGQLGGNDNHTGDFDCPCFGCKVKTLQMNAGDAKHSTVESGTTQKKWDSELAFYKDARAQGVQPEGTSRAQVQKALEASEVLNKPYNGEKMPKANVINKKTVEVMKEVGAI